MTSAAMPPHQGWFDFKLDDTNLLEFWYQENHGIIDEPLPPPPPPSTPSDKFFYVKLRVHDVDRMFYIAEDDGTALWEDEATSTASTRHYIPCHDDDNEVQDNLSRFLSHNIAAVTPDVGTAFAPILSAFLASVMPVDHTIGKGIVVRPIILTVSLVNLQYYDQDNNDIDQMEYEALLPLARGGEEEFSTEKEEFYVDSLEKVRFEQGSSMTEECAICVQEFTEGLDVSRMPCSHVYHEHCILRWFHTKPSCPCCRYELKH